MDNNETLELNAIEQAIATDPVNYLNSQPDPRKWTLSTEDIARSSTVNPYDLFSTITEPEKYSWLENETRGLWKGMKATIEPAITGMMDQGLIDELTYKTPNMSKDDALRIYEDVLRTRSFIRTQQNIRESQKIRNNFWYSMANGVGSMISMATVGLVTRSPAAIGVSTAAATGYQVKGELIDQYIQDEGTSKGLKDKNLEMSAIATAYGSFAGLTEMTIGVERLAAGAINRYAKMDKLVKKAIEAGKPGKAAAIRAGKEFGTSVLEEAGEEFVQSIGEDIAVQGWSEAFTDENFTKALTQAMYGGLIGGPAGAAFYYLGRKQTISKVKEWSDKNKLNLSEQQTMAIADEIIDKGTHQMADQIATMTEINNQFGKAYEVIKARIKETIEATGTTPWTDTGDSSAFDEAWANHEVDKGGTILKFNDKYGTVITITPIVSGKNKGKFQVRAIDRNGRFDMLTEDGTWGNLGQKDENGVAIPWSTKGFDSVQDAYNALKEIYSQPSAESRQAKMDDFVETNAKAVTIPLIMMANVYGMPISDFIEVADLRVAEGTTGKQPMLMFAPISSMEDVERLLEQQKSIIKEQKAAKKLGTERPGALENAERRKAILEIQLERMKQDQKIENARSMRRKQKADYVTAKDLMPTQTTTIDTAVQAEEGQEYVMFAGKKIPVEYQVVELADIQPSHINGEPNPNYTNTELQNRASRGTTQDVADLRGKALPENFTPERLTRAPTSAEGAPVINAQGEVIAGNGRAEIVRYAYENPKTAEKYKKELKKAGFNIEGMNQPILVRRNTTMTPEEQVAAADLSNISETSAFDEASQARMDSKYIKDSKDPLDFASKLPTSERRGLMNNDGTWNNRRVKQRYESALLSWLLGNDTKLFESLVLNGRLPQKVIDILVANGAQIYALNDKYPAANIRADIYHALHKMQYANKDNFIEITQQVEMDPRDVMPENVLVWSWLFADSTMARQLLGNYINILEENHDNVNAGADMFGDKPRELSKKDALMQALHKTDEAKGQLATQKGKDYESLFDPETNEARNTELAMAITSYNNQFAPRPEMPENIVNKIAYTSGPVFFNRPSTKFVLQGGEGQIVHGWGVYSMEDQKLNKQRYRDVFAGKPVFIINEKTQEAVPLASFGMFAQNVSDRAKRIIDENYGTNSIDEVVATNPKTYGGFIGLTALISYMPATYMTDFMNSIAKGKTTFDNIDQDPDYGYIKDRAKNGVKIAKILKSIIESAHKKYNSATLKKNFPDTDTRTWAAISEAVRNLTKTQKEAMLVYMDDTWEMPTKDADIFIQTIQHPENLKRTRGQQLEVNVPEDDQLLNEETFLAEQPSAPLLRKVLEDFAPGGLLYDYVNRTNERNFKAYREKHNIPEQNLKDFHERLLENIMSGLIDGYTTEEIGRNKEVKLLIDYIMENLKGDDFYIATMEAIQDTSIDLQSGETIGEEKDYSEFPNKNVMGIQVSSELARDTSLYLNEMGIKGVTYRGGVDKTGFVIFSDEAIQMLRRLDDEEPIYYKKGPDVMGFYDPELQVLVLGKNWDEVTLVHEMHHRYLLKLWEKYQQAKLGLAPATPAFIEDIGKLFSSLGVTPDQTELTTVQQEKFAYMVEAYLTGFGVDDPNNLAFQGFLHWIPEKVKSIYDLGYLDEQGNIQNPMLDQETIDFFNRWFASPMVPSLPTAPDAQRMVNVANEDGEIAPSEQKVMNNREKDWGQDSERQNKADAQLWQAIGENNPSDLRAALDGEKELMKAEANNNPDDRILPEKPKLRDKWFKTHQPDARELAAEAARAYVAKNPDHARELAFADPETMAEYDAPVDHGMLIRAVMETVQKGSDEWYILDNNLAMVKSMSGSTLSLSGDLSHQAYLDAKREVEEARELKAAVNYAGTRQGAMEKWNEDIRAFAAKRVAAIVATAPNSKEREVAIKAFLEEAKTKFAGNTTNAILNKLDLTGYITKDKGAFVKWAEKQIREVAHARLDTKEQAELMKTSIAAQVALKGINSTEVKDGKYVRAIQSAKDIRHWQYVKDKMKKAYIGRWGRFGIFVDNLFGGYMPSAMLMSVNTLFFANVPSTAINTTIVKNSARWIGENKVDEKVLKGEKERIKQVFNASGLNLAQMEKPSSPSLMHGEKYTNQEQKHWYNFTFDVLSREDNWFRIPTFVDVLGRIATKNAKGDAKKATELFRQYAELGNKDEDAVVARKQALAVANMAVFTQDGIMASALNHIRSQLNNLSRGMLGLEPGGFGLGNMLAPFLKTGANVIEMGLTASLAPIRTATTALRWAQGKEITDARKIALTTDWAYMALAVVATAIMSAITSDDDDWYTEPYETGRRYDPDKPYDSIKVGGVWVKLDIFGPLEVPLRTAALLVKNWEKEKLGALADGMQEAFEEVPLVNQFLDNQMGYMKRKPGDYWRTWGYNQANKLVPAQAKSITRAASRAEGMEWTPGMFEGTNLERKFHRNYGLDGMRLTTNDLLNILTNRIKYVEKK